MEVEIFAPVGGYEGFYEVGTHGTVRSLTRRIERNQRGKAHVMTVTGRILKTGGDTVGYDIICMCTNSKPFFISVHRLVAKTFIPNPDNLPQVNHKDGDKKNNKASNLEWVTVKQNAAHAKANGLQPTFVNGKNTVLTEEQAKKAKRLLRNGIGVHKVAAKLGVKPIIISDISQGKTWKKL